MNKKFSTLLTASLLMVGALFSSAQATDYVPVGPKAEAISSGSMYYIVQQAGEDVAGSGDYLMGMNKTSAPALAGLNIESGNTTLAEAFTLSDGEISNYLWTVTEVKEAGKTYYTLKNVKTQNFLAVDGSFNMVTTVADATQAKSNIYFSFGDGTSAYSGKATETTYLLPKGGAEDASSLLISGTSAIAFGDGSANKVILYSVKTQPVAAVDLNAAFGGAGFSFAPDGVEVEDNIFDQSIKAFDVADDIELEAGVRAIKKGTYFATSYPDELAEEDAITSAEQFDACTFIAVSPTENFKTSKLPQGSGAGFKFVTVKGDDLNTYISGDNLSSKEEVFVGNAAFTVTEPNEFASPGKYTMSLSARVLADPKVSSNKDQNHAAKNIDVIATAIQDVNYITTTVSGEGSLFKVASTKLVKAVSLLKEEKAPSVFNIQFVSGKGKKDSEYNKYMGVAIADGTDFQLVAQGSALAALNTPQYQFVISAIDTKEQIITFKNLETAVTFKSTLFETENEGEYKLVGVATAAADNLNIVEVAKDDKTGYEADKSLEGKVIKLNAVEVDPFAGFAVKDQNSDAVVLKFAKSAALNAEKLYIGVDEDVATNTALYDKDSKAIKVKFIPVEEADKPNGTAQTYCYNKDGKVYTASQKMVTYYSYSAQIIDGEDNDDYLKIGSSDLEIEQDVSDAASATTKYVIKENKDGSVSLFVSTAFAHATNAKAVKSDDGTAISVDGIAYGVEKADAIKLYLVGEELGVSLEAKPRHAAFQSTTGGYISLNDKNEGIVAIKTAADTDLTFWLDTADSKAIIPSFYISHRAANADDARLFMFNTADSVETISGDENPAYVWYPGVNKVIFKAATLVNPDTLSTTVNGKAALVATNADQNKGILGGLNNFKYQILKVADTDNEYYVRNMVDGDYLVSYNGLLTLGEKSNAIKVVLEAGESPVANDAINTSAVSVIAADGSIIIKGAQGKKVAINNILGQTIANTVVTSSEATIAAPAGVVVVAVEGEAAVKAIVK